MSWYFSQIGRATSRLLNAIIGGEGDTTFSAYSYHLMIDGKSRASRVYGRVRVAIVDRLLGSGHCFVAYAWHNKRGLFEIDK
jgi:hypothetical protein